MVKSQLRQGRQWPPLCLCSIILPYDRNGCIYTDKVCHGDSSPSWVTIHFGVCAYLLKLCDFKPSFLFQFTNGALLGSFIHVHETTRESPTPFER